MRVVYLDSVFFLNALADYLLVLATARLAGVPLHRGRLVLTGALGGAYAAAVFLPGMGFLTELPVKAAAGILLAVTAFGGEEKLLRLTLLFFGLACALAGTVLVLGTAAGHSVPVSGGVFYTDVDAWTLLVGACGVYLLWAVVFRAAAHQGIQGRLVPVRLCLDGRTVQLTALCDTGNALRDPVTGRTVLAADGEAVRSLWTGEVRALLDREALHHPADTLERLYRLGRADRFRLLPYRAVGISGGLLLAVRTDWVELGGVRYAHMLAALSPTALGDGCTALWGGAERMGADEKAERGTWQTAGADGTFAGGRSPLHWGQRCAAAALDTVQGGGTADPAEG